MEIIAKLKNQGWYLTDDGIKKLPEDVDKSDTTKIIQAAMDVDFREIARGALPTDLSKKDETMPGRVVLQISKIRNIAAPKADEENRYAPRLFQLDLTDGVNQMQALEIENISSLNFNTPPGTKIYLTSERIPLMQGMLILKSNDIQVLGGKVPNLIEKWEMSRTLLKYAKGGRVMNGGTSGPPPWTPFGQRIQQQNVNVGNDKNFRSLAAANEKEGKENNEFDAMRNEAIAEAAKAGSKKVFGGGNQQIVDHNVKKIMEKGYTEEEAKNTLRATRNNLEKALFNLKRRDEYKNKDDSKSSGYDKSKSNTQTSDRNGSNINKRGVNNNTRDNFSNKKGGKDDLVSTKPAGNVSLFDFLTDKLPSNSNETEKSSTNSTQNQQQYGTSSSLTQQQSQPSRYDSRSDRPPRTSDSYNSSNAKPSYYNNNNNNNSQQQQSSSYSDNRNQNNQQNQQHHIPNSQSSRSTVNQKFENNLSSSFQANRNYSQDNDRSKNRSNRDSTERSAASASNVSSNRNYQNSYQGRGGGNNNDRQYDEQNSDRHYNNRDQRNNNYNQRNPKSQQGNERDGSSRSGGNDRNNYQGSNTSHFQYHQHQNNSGNNYDNNRNSRNDNQSYRNGYDNSRSGGASGNYSYKGNHSQISSRYSQKENSSNSYQSNQSQNHGSNSSRNYSDNRQQSYHQQHSNQNNDAKLNKIIEDTSKLKIDSQTQHQQQQPQQQMQQHTQSQHSQKSRHNQNTNSQRNQNLTYQQQQQQQQQQHIASQHQPQIMTVVSHQGPPPNQSQLPQHTVQTNQQQQQHQHAHFQAPPQVHSAQHSLQASAFTQLPNGFAYDPNKIMGFQNKETNDFAMTLLKSQGIPTALTPTTALAPPQPPHSHPSVTPNAAPQPATQHPGTAGYPTMQIGHPPPPTISQHSFATAGPTFVMQPASIAPPPQLATLGSQVAHTHTPVGAGLPGSLQGPPQPSPGAAFSMNSGESWNWKIGDRCLAKYWDDGRYYEAEITGISDKTCVVFYLGYGNHEEVLKSDCLPITDAQNRAINFGATQAATVVALQQQPPPPTAVQLAGASRGGLPNRYRGDRQMYVPPPKRDG